MITLEQVEKLREKANVSFEDAKAALEVSGGDLLGAIIQLEKQGKVTTPAGGGYYSSQNTGPEEKKEPNEKQKKKEARGETFGDMMRRLFRFCGEILNRGNNNYLEAERAGGPCFSLPVTVVAVLTIFFFWVVVPLFIISLFFGFRYRFRGSDLGKESVNRVMDGASNTVEEIKRSINNDMK